MTSYAPADALAIEADGLVKVFGEQRAVDGVSLTVPQGAVYGVLGPNGAGKTTTIRMLATLLRPTAGSARIFGHDVVAEPTAVRSLIGVTGQYASVDEKLSATENLIIFSRLLGLSRAESRRRATDLLEEFGLTDAATKPLENFSGGMRRRLDLAASLISTPPLLFLDEPTTGLDPRTRAQMWETIRRLVREGATVLLTTQYLDEADQLADRIAVIDHGRLIADGTSDELKASVGLSTLQLTLTDRTLLGKAGDLLGEFLGRATGKPVETTITPEAGRITTPLHDASLTADLLIWLRDNDIRVEEINVSKPSLDEVFFALTGHGAESDTSTTDSERSAA
ncbi:ATP-binding cassette domain-containing protein [Nocardia macrotermitis]|uniref:Daunorubicin/doxorubicin resistance ATP-binding protein DrrA n=1 Tax=Nocardia macrotermitis TaxID=2585198 RepID=A0A7K0CXW7_9NOCA|nr:ATP-binding cassette domain-containing protein [Nocardia macrotermitis]MQY18273.1 Daunorubicin/doxorubicin resistance ATP-binding protein DrrA [Nocardia macrotermitis]